jgi:hypothetical protein
VVLLSCQADPELSVVSDVPFRVYDLAQKCDIFWEKQRLYPFKSTVVPGARLQPRSDSL